MGAAGVGKTQLCLQLTAIAATLGDSQPGTQVRSIGSARAIGTKLGVIQSSVHHPDFDSRNFRGKIMWSLMEKKLSTTACVEVSPMHTKTHESTRWLQPGVVYFDTERGRFSAKRLRDIASERFPEVYTTPASLTSLLSRIHVSTPDTTAGLLHQLQVRNKQQTIENALDECVSSLLHLGSFSKHIRNARAQHCRAAHLHIGRWCCSCLMPADCGSSC